jgi:uncharacterized membrane protein
MNALVSRASRGRRAGWVAMTVLAITTALIASRYFTLDPETFIPQQKMVYLANLGPLMLHVGGAVVALVLGPWQFVRRLRARRPAVHRFIGRVYLVSVLATGVGGLLLAPTALFGPVARLGFGALAVLVLGTSAAAYVSIRRRQVARHRAWMTRSYALIFTGVTFRLWISGLPVLGVPFEQAYRSGAWAAWIINLVVAELLIIRARNRSAVTLPLTRSGDAAVARAEDPQRVGVRSR